MTGWDRRIGEAIHARRDLLDRLGEATDCVRLFHGATEGVPGLAVDRYGPVLLVQTWRAPLADGELDAIQAAVRGHLGVELVPCWNHRARDAGPFDAHHRPDLPDAPIGREDGLRYRVDPRHRGQDPLLFLDFRAGRRRVRAEAEGRSVLNLFAYTCGIGAAARAGGAREVLDVDFAASALEWGEVNASLNGQQEAFHALHFDALPVMRRLAGQRLRDRRRGRRLPEPPVTPRGYDLVVLDPPRWARSRWGAVDVVRDYPSLFKPCVQIAAPGGVVLATNHVPSVDLDDWLDILRRCADKAGHPLREIEVLAPDADFPSPDGRHPLKLAWCTLEG